MWKLTVKELKKTLSYLIISTCLLTNIVKGQPTFPIKILNTHDGFSSCFLFHIMRCQFRETLALNKLSQDPEKIDTEESNSPYNAYQKSELAGRNIPLILKVYARDKRSTLIGLRRAVVSCFHKCNDNHAFSMLNSPSRVRDYGYRQRLI